VQKRHCIATLVGYGTAAPMQVPVQWHRSGWNSEGTHGRIQKAWLEATGGGGDGVDLPAFIHLGKEPAPERNYYFLL